MVQLSSLPSKQWFSGLDFPHPMVLPIIPWEATELPSPCVQLITFIDLIGSPGHFSKTVIENAAWQASRSWGIGLGPESRGGWQLSHQPLQQGTPNAGATDADLRAFPPLQTGLRDRLRPGREATWSCDKTVLFAVNLIRSKAAMVQRPRVIFSFSEILTKVPTSVSVWSPLSLSLQVSGQSWAHLRGGCDSEGRDESVSKQMLRPLGMMEGFEENQNLWEWEYYKGL